jgi:hypothetical protein
MSVRQDAEKHPRHLTDGNILVIRLKGGLPFRADPERHRLSPPGRRPGFRKGRSRKRNEGTAPAPASAKRPQGEAGGTSISGPGR